MSIREYNELKVACKQHGFDREVVLDRVVEIAEAIAKASIQGKHGSVIMKLAGRIAKQCE